MAKKKVLFTFDYEMFSKRSGSVDNCLIKPVNALQKVFREYGIHATFFVDAVFLERIKKEDTLEQEYIKITDQLLSLLKDGHRIELHIHPHWRYAVFDNSEFFIRDVRHFNIMNFSEKEINELILSGVQLLNGIIKKYNPKYKMIAYRGGGWCIQPFKKIAPVLKKAGIFLDSTVAKGYKKDSGFQYYDFLSAPDKEYYFFEEDPVKEVKTWSFLEIPITTYRLPLFLKLRRAVSKRLLNIEEKKIYGDGEGLIIEDHSNNGTITKKIIKEYFLDYNMLSLQNIIPEIFIKIVQIQKRDIFNIISHPKNLSKLSISGIRKLADTGDYTFMTLKDLYEDIILHK